jgi:isopenicillin N synthase-like dioxygenase
LEVVVTAALKATRVSDAALPIIDIGGLSSALPAKRLAVGQRLRAACLDNGFFYVANHGVPAGLMEAVFTEAKTFFDRSPDRKSEVDKSRSPAIAAMSLCARRRWKPVRRPT